MIKDTKFSYVINKRQIFFSGLITDFLWTVDAWHSGGNIVKILRER